MNFSPNRGKVRARERGEEGEKAEAQRHEVCSTGWFGRKGKREKTLSMGRRKGSKGGGRERERLRERLGKAERKRREI